MPPQSRSGLLEDLRRRAEAVDQACKRSNEMERAFLEKKVLNREANEALEDFGRKRGQFGEYLLQRSDEIIAALSENRAQEPSEIEVNAVAVIIAESPLIDAPKLNHHAWKGLARHILEAASAIRSVT